MSRMQTDLQDSEELVHHKDSQIYQLNYEQDRLRSQVAELQQTVRAFNNIFAMNRTEFESQQADYYSKKTQLVTAESQIRELRHALLRATSSSRTEYDEAMAERANELSKLREFADRKDDVVRQQGGVIARGATIIRERDDTIERLSKELKISVDDHRHEVRERERFARLLEEKTQEIAQLKDDMSRPGVANKTPEADLTGSNDNHETEGEARSMPITPIAFGAQQDHLQNSGQWTPQTLDQYAKLPHEQRRAAAWETGPIAFDKAKFGEAGLMSLRRSNSLKMLENLALVEEGHQTVSPTAVKSGTRYKLPLDNPPSRKQNCMCSLSDTAHSTRGPILPDIKPVSRKVPVRPADASSFQAYETPPALPPQLSRSRDDGTAGHAEPTSVHQHVHTEKPRRSLQAYVEVEDSGQPREAW